MSGPRMGMRGLRKKIPKIYLFRREGISMPGPWGCGAYEKKFLKFISSVERASLCPACPTCHILSMAKSDEFIVNFL